MTSKEKTTTQALPAGYNVFRRPFFSKNGNQATVSRKVIPYDKLNKAESMAIKRLFEALVPHDKTVPIDERLIWEEGLPAFEQFLGGQRFKKLKRYFGIGYNPLCKNLADEKEVRTMLSELRTIENARFYLHGFKDLIDRFADRLEGAPEGMDNITKAKVLRMFLVVFCSYYYFIEEFDFKPVMVEVEKEVDGKMQKVSDPQIQTVINRQRAIANNSVPFYPEVLFGLENLKFDKCGATTILYAPIAEEILFRKLLIDRTIKYGQGISILMSAFIFGLFHGNLNQFVYAFTLGAVFAYVYSKTGNIKYTILMHMVVNFLGSIVGVLILKVSGMLEMMNIDPTDIEAITNIMTNHVGGLIIMFIYFIIVIALVITGIVLFCVNIRKIQINKTEDTVPQGKRFATYFVNIGMIAFFIYWIAMIIYQLFR